MRRAVDALEALFPAVRKGEISAPDRTLLMTNKAEPHRQLMTGTASWNARDIACVKVTTLTPDNPADGRELINGAVIVLDLKSGTPKLMVEGGALTGLRTGAVAGLAVRHLSGPVKQLALIGAGVQARWAALSLMQEAEFETLHLASRGAKRRDALADWISARSRPGQSIKVFESARAAVEGCDLVCTATSAHDAGPVLHRAWLSRSALCVALGGANETACEIDPAWAAQATLYVEDRREALSEAGEIRALGVAPEQLTEIADTIEGRSAPCLEGPRLFRSVGSAAMDLAGALTVLER